MRRPTPIHHIPLVLLLGWLTTHANSVMAQSYFEPGTLQPGQLILNLDASEQTEVEQDTLHANLYYSAQGRDRVALQNEVNSNMTAALAMLEGSAVDYSTQQYHVYQVQAGRPARADIENPVWRAQQGVLLTSTDSAALLEIAAKLQGMGLVMGSLNYSLSPARYEEVSDSLLDAALSKLRTRAETTASILGKRQAELIEVSLNASNNYYERGMPMIAMSAEAAVDMTQPAAEPGMTTVMISVSARAILSP